MKLGHRDVYDLHVFDLDGRLVTELNTLTKFHVNYIPSEDTYYVIAYDGLLDEKLLMYISKVNSRSDYDKALGSKRTISIGKIKGKQFKLIAKSVMRDSETSCDKDITLEFPLVEMISQPIFITDVNRLSEFDVAFKVIQQDDEEFYKIHM